MTMQNSTFDNLIDSFKKICFNLEAKAEFDLKQIEKECEQECILSAKSLQKFNEIIHGISETCSEVVSANEILKYGTKRTERNNSIHLPYEMQSDFVKCVNELYNLPCIGTGAREGKLVNEKNKELVNEITKISEKNIHDIKDVQNTIAEAKEIL